MSFRAQVLGEESAPLLLMITYFVYLISNKSRRLYTGITKYLVVRMLQHKFKAFPDSFTARYNFDMLVYFERYYDPHSAIARETEIKKWRREKKLKLIAEMNPDWADLSADGGKTKVGEHYQTQNIDRSCARVLARNKRQQGSPAHAGFAGAGVERSRFLAQRQRSE